MSLIIIENDGPRIRRTNYWETEHAHSGFCYLSGNAGTLRLLVPEKIESRHLNDMMESQGLVVIETSLTLAGGWDIVFQDGSSSPFFIAIDPRQCDRKLSPMMCKFAVWTEHGGAVIERDCLVRF